MNNCETCEARISALMDGELEPAEVIDALDHAMACDSCRRFYLENRKVDRIVRPEGIGVVPMKVTDLLPEGGWERIERAGALSSLNSFREWGLRAAALVVVAFGLWNVGGLTKEPLRAPEKSYDISLGEGESGMTETRFVAMTAELLQSDRRYHRAMYQAMKDVREATGTVEGSEDVPAVDGEEQDYTPREGDSRLPS